MLALIGISLSACGGDDERSPGGPAAADARALCKQNSDAEDTASVNAVTTYAVGPWARSAAEGQRVTAAYLTLCNSGTAPIVLTGAASPIAVAAEIHQTTTDADGVARMTLAPPLTIAPGDGLRLSPGGPHVMLIGLAAPLAPGAVAPFTLSFEDGTTLAVEAPARAIAGASN
ncbi:MAG: copper chaperone PCu(A)C [Pseudomonadota bacterium]